MSPERIEETDLHNGPLNKHLQVCRYCERFLSPPQTWVKAEPRSNELLQVLLKRLQNLNKRLVRAVFAPEPYDSKRILIMVTVQGDAKGGSTFEETFPVLFELDDEQCPDCAKSFTAHTWRACLQLRQKVPHKCTFFYLEQLILKNHPHIENVSSTDTKDGIDLYFAQPNHATKMLDFLSMVAPVRAERSHQLISTDAQEGSDQYKFTHLVEIAPICREDLVVLPRSVSSKLSHINRVVLCTRSTSTIYFLDPTTLETAEVQAKIYWRAPFGALMTWKDLTEFIVLECEPLEESDGPLELADVTVARASHMDQSYIVRSHLGADLKPGDSVAGYYLVDCNFNDDEFDSLPEGSRPDVVLVKKMYPLSGQTKRNWKLKRLITEAQEVDDAQVDRSAADYEAFLQDLEQDKKFRAQVNLYRVDSQVQEDVVEDADADDDGNTIEDSELLEDMGDV